MIWKPTVVTPSPSVRSLLIYEWITGGGLAGSPIPSSMANEGTAMRRALARDFAAIPGGRLRVVVTLDDRLSDDPGPWIIEPIGVVDKADRVACLARQCDLTLLIAPETSGILVHQTRMLEAAGARLIGSSAEAVELAGDKLALANHLSARGIPTPPSQAVRPSDGLPREARYPAVLKPIDGAGSIDTYLIPGLHETPQDFFALEQALLQPYISGQPMSATFLVDLHGRSWLLAIASQNIVVSGGRFAYRGGRIPAPGPVDLVPIRKAVDSVAGLRGLVGLDFVWNPSMRDVQVLEINPRPTTSVVGIVRLLSPGKLASAWLGAWKSPPDSILLEGLADEVRAGGAIAFDAAGTILDREEAAS